MALALDANFAQRFGFKERGHKTVGIFRNLDRARGRCLLHPCSQVDCVAHGCVLAMHVGADLTGDDQAGVDAHPYVEIDVLQAIDQFPKRGNVFKNGEAGQQRPFRVVFVGHGGAKEGQNGIAHQPGNVAPVTVYRLV